MLAGPFPHVKIFMTDIDVASRRFRWTDTKLVGTLKLTVQSEVSGIPLASIKVTDGAEEESIFEYELPLNFTHDCNISNTFYAIKVGTNEQYFGFKMQNEVDKQSLTQKMKYLAKLLHKSHR